MFGENFVPSGLNTRGKCVNPIAPACSFPLGKTVSEMKKLSFFLSQNTNHIWFEHMVTKFSGISIH